METKPQEKYRNTFEFWHKGIVATLLFQIRTDKAECGSCEGYDLEVLSFHSKNPIHGTIEVAYICRDCDHIEKIEYPVVSSKRIEKYDGNSDKIDYLLKNNLQFEKL